MVNCSKCGKNLGILSSKHKLENDSVLCSTCFEKWEEQQTEKNRNIMLDYISKYISNKNTELDGYILGLHKNKNVNILFDEHDLNRVIEHFNTLLHNAEYSNKSGLSSHEIDEIIDTTKMCEEILDFLNDLEKMYKLFKKKDIETDYFEILSLFAEVIENNLNKECDKFVNPAYIRISKQLGKDINLEKVIEELMKTPFDTDNFNFISRLLDRFNLEYEQEEVEEIIEKVKEDIELEEFEKHLGSSQKIDIGDFTMLSGYEFEEYLKTLFKLLGYVVIKTSLSGDQGADLVVSKDNEKTVVQAKKYNGKVSNKTIQEIVTAKNHYKADKAIVVTNSSFTKSAIELALSNNVELWDGMKLKSLVKNLKPTTKEKGVSTKTFTMKDNKNIQKISMPCPFCNEEVEHELDLRRHDIDEIECPHCSIGINVQVTKRSWSWRCEYCSQGFDTKHKAEKHEKNCKKRK